MKNVILIIMDCARAKLLTPELCPFILSLAERGINFKNHYATAPWTLPSHASMFTGLYTREHGTEHDNVVLPRRFSTFAERFKEAGYRTAAFSNNPWIGPHTGLDRGFDHFEGVWPSRIRRLPIGLGLRRKLKKVIMEYTSFLDAQDSGANKTNDRVWKWFKNLPGTDAAQNYFLYVNYMELHHPFKPPEPYRSKFYKKDIPITDLEQDYRKIYTKTPTGIIDFEAMELLCKAEMAYLDNKIKELFDRIDNGNTIWVITADHGDLFGEEGGLAGHRFSLHKNLLHVPLVLYGTGGKFKYDGLTQHVDLYNVFTNYLKWKDLNYPSWKRDYGFAEHTDPRPVLEQFGEIERFGPEFDVKDVEWDLVSCFDLAGQLIRKKKRNEMKDVFRPWIRSDGPVRYIDELNKWKKQHPRLNLPESEKVGFGEIFKHLRSQGFLQC